MGRKHPQQGQIEGQTEGKNERYTEGQTDQHTNRQVDEVWPRLWNIVQNQTFHFWGPVKPCDGPFYPKFENICKEILKFLTKVSSLL